MSKNRTSWSVVWPLIAAMAMACGSTSRAPAEAAVRAQAPERGTWDDKVEGNVERLFDEGRRVFRADTFGSEVFWGDQLQLHRAIAGEKNGGVGPGVTAQQALQLGLKVDVTALPQSIVDALKAGAVDLDSPDTTLALLRLDSVVGVKGTFDAEQRITSIGITCALCHSTVDDSFTSGIGRRLDGWPNRDLNVGAIVAAAPNLEPFAQLLQTDTATVTQVLSSWGPGRYDAELNLDGKAFRPDGKTGATLLPAAFGLAGQNLHTYTGWGSVPYWNAYVANLQMRGQGVFVDRRLADATKFPVAARAGFADKRDAEDKITSKLAALQLYQLAIPAPRPPIGSYDEGAARRGEKVFAGKARCASCHVPPLFSEPGYAMHTAAELGIDDFQSSRSPDGMYRTTPLAGLFTRAKGGYYHDGRFADLGEVVGHYDTVFSLGLTTSERADLIEYLRSL